MTTQSWSSPLQSNTDAAWQTLCNEMYVNLVAVGLVQTADTGQLAYPVVAARPGVNNTSAGCWIFSMNDSLQATAPLFIRIDMGRGSNSNTNRFWITVGTSTNGASVITGDATTLASFTHGLNAATLATNRTSRVCKVDGFVGIQFKILGGSAGEGAFYLQRWCNSAGTILGTGYHLACAGSAYGSGGLLAIQYSVDTVNHAVFSGTGEVGNTSLSLIPLGLTTSVTTAGDLQAFQCFSGRRAIYPLWALCSLLLAEGATGTTLTVAMVGTTPRTYISGGTEQQGVGAFTSTAVAGSYLAMIWE